MMRDAQQMFGTMHARIVEADLQHQIGKLRYVARRYPGARMVVEGVISGLERDREACDKWAMYGQAVTDEEYARRLLEEEDRAGRGLDER